MNFIKWIVAGSIGGLAGAAIWAGISYALNAEVGWIAWGIGGMVGIFVRVAAGESDEGPAPGITAAAIAIGSVLLGKFLAVHFLVSSLLANDTQPPPELTEKHMIIRLADDIIEAREAKGQKVVFPNGKSMEEATEPTDYPTDIWQQAQAKWKSIPAADQQKQITEARVQQQAMLEMFRTSIHSEVRQAGFLGSFGIFDALWFFLAAGTAYRIGAGAATDD
ncbi:hypothetical protein NA78x_001671 [Anatilimnocola sp. NA78]|uniref:hypothetical protein n=1 Tax=Anatilimnocola sp. NA78 TaxID=3415683 RepID=UPI003CE544F8